MTRNQKPGIGTEIAGHFYKEAGYGYGWFVHTGDVFPYLNGSLQPIGGFAHAGGSGSTPLGRSSRGDRRRLPVGPHAAEGHSPVDRRPLPERRHVGSRRVYGAGQLLGAGASFAKKRPTLPSWAAEGLVPS